MFKFVGINGDSVDCVGRERCCEGRVCLERKCDDRVWMWGERESVWGVIVRVGSERVMSGKEWVFWRVSRMGENKGKYVRRESVCGEKERLWMCYESECVGRVWMYW